MQGRSGLQAQDGRTGQETSRPNMQKGRGSDGDGGGDDDGDGVFLELIVLEHSGGKHA